MMRTVKISSRPITINAPKIHFAKEGIAEKVIEGP
ncbi:MAG: hypothetical protein ACI9O2_001039, partial [Flammeovirgaceae bacterium]